MRSLTNVPSGLSGSFACAMKQPSSVRGEIHDLVEHARLLAAVIDQAIRRFDEAVFVDAGVGRQRADQTDVRAFRRLNRADARVVRVVNVSNLEGRAVAVQAAGPSADRRRLWVSSASGFG